MDTKPKSAEDDTAHAFLPVARSVQFNGQDLTVDTLDVLQIIKISGTLKKVLPALDHVQALMDRPGADLAEPGAAELGIVVELLADYGEPLTEAVAIAIRRPLAEVQGSKDVTGLVELIFAIVKVNADFFVHQAGPRLAALRERLASGGGLTPSTVLSAPATH